MRAVRRGGRRRAAGGGTEGGSIVGRRWSEFRWGSNDYVHESQIQILKAVEAKMYQRYRENSLEGLGKNGAPFYGLGTVKLSFISLVSFLFLPMTLPLDPLASIC